MFTFREVLRYSSWPSRPPTAWCRSGGSKVGIQTGEGQRPSPHNKEGIECDVCW
jgi:hypothetical protein